MAYPFKNLVFQGGGVKTFAYRGALEVLEAEGILSHIERVAGTSAGAMLAALLSFRLPVDEIFQIMNTLDFARMSSANTTSRELPSSAPEVLIAYLERLSGGANALSRLMLHYGWYSSSYAQNWIQDVVAAHCDGNGMATFADFRQRGFRGLYVVCTNISQRRTQIFSAQHTPDTPVAHALVMSQSIPLFFAAFQFDGTAVRQGDYYVDGGVLDNYPLHLFDSPEFQDSSAWFIAGINWETLGCRLYTPQDRAAAARPIGNVIQYVENLLETLLEAQEVAYDNNIVDHHRTINISNCGVPTRPSWTRIIPLAVTSGSG
jgi:NTE family protein